MIDAINEDPPEIPPFRTEMCYLGGFRVNSLNRQVAATPMNDSQQGVEEWGHNTSGVLGVDRLDSEGRHS